MLLKDLRPNVLELLEDIYKHEAEKGATSDYISFLTECKNEAEKAQSSEDIATILQKLQYHNEFKKHFSSDHSTSSAISKNTGYAERLLKCLKNCAESAATISLESAQRALISFRTALKLAQKALASSQASVESMEDIESSQTTLQASETALQASQAALEASKKSLNSLKACLKSADLKALQILESSQATLESSQAAFISSQATLESVVKLSNQIPSAPPETAPKASGSSQLPATLELALIESNSDSTQTPPVSHAMTKTALKLSQTSTILDEKDFSILDQEDLATLDQEDLAIPNQKTSEALDKEEKLKKEQFLAIKQALKASNTSTEKQQALDSCTTLQQLCFATAIRRKGGLFHPKHTTATGDLLLQLLKCSEYSLLKQDVFPGNQRVSMRGIRHYGLYGTQAPQHGYFLNTKARDDEDFFSLSNNPDKNQPMLLFDRYFKNDHNSSYDHDYSAVENLNP
ncbi:hypothetical protein [Piscirickettsia salmonis]|uniref:hypothetical protein n=2 Tax=Piscirickettsia salmonis TaxID=1238 RepID=UPI0012BAF80C|nr:hypothetical protein [Piscirickettsia salmonis]QGP58936.1 hypothetical protein PsalBI1_01518 [Piscirickettsia salmonis]